MKKMGILSLIVVLLAVGAVGCTSTGGAADTGEKGDKTVTKAEYHKISQEEAKERMDTHENVVIVDVREKNEYDEGHIKDAILIPLGTIGDTMPEELLDLEQEILVYCRSGKRSEQASRKLVALGYKNVYDFGGILSWPYGVA